MNKVTSYLLIVLSMSFLLMACAKKEGPRVVYDQFTVKLNEMDSFSSKPISQFLTKRATEKMNKGFSMIEKQPEARRKPLEMMALTMLQQSALWLDPKSAELNIDSNSASLTATVVNNDNTIVTEILFKNEGGWKIDLISKNSKSSDGKTKFGESLFE